MIVYKFGGALGKSRRGLEALIRLVRETYRVEFARQRRHERARISQRETKSPPLDGLLLVVSAIGHTTRQLARAAELAELSHLKQAEDALDRTVTQHKQLASSLQIEEEQSLFDTLDEVASDVRGLLEGITITRELSPRTRDAVISNGERLSGALVHALLRDRELPVRLIDAREIIVTDEQFGHAEPILEEIEARVNRLVVPRLKRSEIVLTQGFIGATRDGITTTMGSESSDLTATLLANVLHASELVIWKTVPGIFAADPEIVTNAKLLRSLSFEEAEEIGRRGARILFPTFAHPLLRPGSKTVLRIATPWAKSTRHTLLTREVTNVPRAQKALAVVVDQHLVALRLVRKSGHDTTRHSAAEHRTKEERLQTIMSRAIIKWTTASETTLLLNKEDKTELLNEIDREEFALFEQSNLSTIAIVIRKSKDARPDGRFFAQIARSLRGFYVHGILSVEQSILAIVNDPEAISAMKKLHHDLF
jgi:aspartate kinase